MLKILDRLQAVLFFVGLILIWEIACRAFKVPDFLLPAPSQIIGRLAQIPDRMLMHAWATLEEILAGFFIAVLGGVSLAILTAHSRFLTKTLYPLLVMTQTIPTIAIAPLLVVWFGPTAVARLIVVFLISFFPVFVSTVSGLRHADEELILLVRGLNGSRWKAFTKIRWPSAMPHVFAGLRIAITLSVIGAVVAEFVAATRGLGYLVFTGATDLDTDLVFGGVVVLAVMGVCLFQLVRLAQQWMVPWATETDDSEM